MTDVQVVRGTPNADELAAVVASLAALAAAGDASPSLPPPAAWADRARLTPRAVPFGPPGWQAVAR